MLSPNAIAVEGVGFSPLLLAARGLLPSESIASIVGVTCVHVMGQLRTAVAAFASVCTIVTASGSQTVEVEPYASLSAYAIPDARVSVTVEVFGELQTRVFECGQVATVTCTARAACEVSVAGGLGAQIETTSGPTAKVEVSGRAAATIVAAGNHTTTTAANARNCGD